MSGTTAPAAQSWWQSLQNHIENLLHKLHLSVQDVVHLLSFFAMGIISGYIIKKYFKYFFVLTLLVIIVLMALSYFNLISFSWDNMQKITGVDPHSTVKQLIENGYNLIRQNIGLSISTLLGIVVGYRIG